MNRVRRESERYLDNPLVATLLGIADRFRLRRQLEPLSETERAEGKTALITGASSGLGFATAVDLARRGARVLMADCRDVSGAVERARQLSRSDKLEGLPLDLSDLSVIEEQCAALERTRQRIDITVLCAAIVPAALRPTRQGLNEMFVVNYLSSFVLLRHLLVSGVIPNRTITTQPALAAPRPRIIFVSSEAHRWSEDLELGDLGRFREHRLAKIMANYSYYKLMLTTFAMELARRLQTQDEPDVLVFALCPGAMNTNIARETPALAKPLMRAVMRIFFQDPFTADEPVLYLACSRALESQTSLYLHRMIRKPVDHRAADPALGQALWAQSEALLSSVGSRVR